MLARPGLSALACSYDFVNRHWGHRAPLPRALRQEMRIVQGLVFLAEVSLGTSWLPRVYAADASSKGYG
eukprot:11410344-Alexandrium_andersonii.AAC.1